VAEQSSDILVPLSEPATTDPPPADAATPEVPAAPDGGALEPDPSLASSDADAQPSVSLPGDATEPAADPVTDTVVPVDSATADPGSSAPPPDPAAAAPVDPTGAATDAAPPDAAAPDAAAPDAAAAAPADAVESTADPVTTPPADSTVPPAEPLPPTPPAVSSLPADGTSVAAGAGGTGNAATEIPLPFQEAAQPSGPATSPTVDLTQGAALEVISPDIEAQIARRRGDADPSAAFASVTGGGPRLQDVPLRGGAGQGSSQQSQDTTSLLSSEPGYPQFTRMHRSEEDRAALGTSLPVAPPRAPVVNGSGGAASSPGGSSVPGFALMLALFCLAVSALLQRLRQALCIWRQVAFVSPLERPPDLSLRS
jgi:hypothetical protein